MNAATLAFQPDERPGFRIRCVRGRQQLHSPASHANETGCGVVNRLPQCGNQHAAKRSNADRANPGGLRAPWRQESGTDDDIGACAIQGPENFGNVGGFVPAIAIDADYRSKSVSERYAVARSQALREAMAPRQAQDMGARSSSSLLGVISGMIVDDQDRRKRERLLNRTHDLADRCFFITGRNNDNHTRFHHARASFEAVIG